MANEVSAWLKNPARKYSEGIALYNKYKADNSRDQFFAQLAEAPANSMHFKLLATQIERINRKLLSNTTAVKAQSSNIKSISVKEITLPTEKQQANKVERPVISDNPLVDITKLPGELKPKFLRNKDITKQMARLHQQLKDLGEGKEFNESRKSLATELAALDDERSGNWKEIDAWWYANKVENTEEKKEVETNKFEDLKAKVNRINNLENYIRRKKAKESKTPEAKKRTDIKIANWQKELDGLTGKTN